MFDEEPDRDPHGECRAEIARLTAELDAAWAVPADVEAAIDAYEARVTSLVTSMTGRAADDAAAVDVARNNLRAAIAADKAALDATWRAHDLERDAEVAQAQAATHEACAALQAICAALHVTPPTGSTYCAEAVAMVVERVAADKARAVEAAEDAAFIRGRDAVRKYPDGWGLVARPTPDEARRLVDAFVRAVSPARYDKDTALTARAALLRALGVEA